jgi:uncharacterized protein YigE (DUF2233 family)
MLVATPITTFVPSPTPLVDTGWQPLRTGLERRVIKLYDQEGRQIESLYLLRIVPDEFVFAIAHSPGEPKTLAEWQAETGALLVVNGGFFTPEYESTGLTVVNGQKYGSSYDGFGGMLAINGTGPELRAVAESPYDPAERDWYVLQSFPLLVSRGGTLAYASDEDDSARRTVVAQDRQGRILFIVAPWGRFSLTDLSEYLLKSDLSIDIAVNLDGGASTGLLLAHPDEGIPAFTLLPTVITIAPR